jgi:hypothetical protein
LYLSKPDLKEFTEKLESEQGNSAGDEEMKESIGQYGYGGMASSKTVKVGIQDSSDDDIMYSRSNDLKKSVNFDRFATFSLEIAFINRIIKVQDSSVILSKLLGFEEHPRGKAQKTQNNGKFQKKKEETVCSNLSDCFEYFRQAEKLDGDNTWYCNSCKDHV